MLHLLRNNLFVCALLWLMGLSPLHAAETESAQEALSRGDYQNAAELARAVLATSPDSHTWTVLGLALAAQGKPVEAERSFREAIAIQPAESLRARVALAVLRIDSEDRDAAREELQNALDEYGDRTEVLRSRELQSLGDAARLLASTDAALFRTAVDFYRLAIERDADNLSARVALGDLLLEKHNNADALRTYRAALQRNDAYAPAILGLARSQHFDHLPAALQTAVASVEAQPTLIAAHTFIARLHLEQQNYAAAEEHLTTALAVNPLSRQALAMRAALHYLTDDTPRMERQLQTLQELAPHSSGAYTLLAEMAARTRRYRDAVNFALVGLTLDDTNWDAMAALGINRLRLGQMESGRRVLEVAFRGDPFNVRVKNTLDLLDKLDEFDTVRSQRFILQAERGRAEVLAPYLLPIAEAAYDYYADRYAYQLPHPLRIEVYSEHADFSVRTVGLTGLDILGASFGPVVLLDSPRTGAFGAFNWASALWHEIAHSFHLAMSDHRAPRWFSEGLAVAEERLARPGWGGDVSPAFLRAYQEGKLRKASDLEEAFLAPRFPNEIPFTYYLASLLVERIESEHGADTLVKLLHEFASGDTSMASVARHLGYTSAQFDQWLDDYVRTRYADALAALYPDGDAAATAHFDGLLAQGKSALAAGDLESAQRALTAAQELFPEHAGPGSSYHDLAELYHQLDDLDNAIAQLQTNIGIDADDLDAHLKLLALLVERGDRREAEDVARRALLIQPFNADTHQLLAEMYEQRAEYELAVSGRRAVLSLDPSDPVQARYQLADTLRKSGEIEQARTELLRALENAPLYEAGLELLLQIRDDLGLAAPTRATGDAAGQPDS